MPGNFYNGEFFGGGYFGALTTAIPARGTAPWLWSGVYAPTEKDIRRSRERFGIPDEAARVVAEVAARQAQRLESDAHKRFEELQRELALRRIEWNAKYLEALNVEREALIDAEIAARLKHKLAEETMLLMLVAASA